MSRKFFVITKYIIFDCRNLILFADLQGVKKGIVEIANILAVTKADGILLPAAKKTASDYKGALNVLQKSSSNSQNIWRPRVLLTSSVSRDGLDNLWDAIQDYKRFLATDNRLDILRQKQAKYWMWKQFTRLMQERMRKDPGLCSKALRLEADLMHRNLTPRVAAQKLLDGVVDKIIKS
jgi:LAO/AO transport system kinase